MANEKIKLQDFTEETAPIGTDVLPITDNGTQRLRRVSLQNLLHADGGVTTQAELEAALTDNQYARIKDGDLTISTTVTTPYRIGGLIQGRGSGESSSSGQAGAVSAITWGGDRDAGTTTIDYYNGSVQTDGGTRPTNTLLYMIAAKLACRDFAFRGATRAQIDAATAKCPLAILMSQDQGGIGSGKLLLDNVYFEHFGTCIQSGVAWDEHNNDESSFRHVFVKNCDTFLQLNSVQSLGWYIEELHHAADGGVVFDIHGGGDIRQASGYYALPCTVLNFNANAQATYGGNVSKYTLRNCKFDSQSLDGLKVVEMETGDDYYADIFVEPHFPTGTPSAPLFNIGGRTVCRISNATNLYAGSLAFNSANCVYVITNSTLYGSITTAADLFDLTVCPDSVTCQVVMQNCFMESTRTRITDYDDVVTGTQV